MTPLAAGEMALVAAEDAFVRDDGRRDPRVFAGACPSDRRHLGERAAEVGRAPRALLPDGELLAVQRQTIDSFEQRPLGGRHVQPE